MEVNYKHTPKPASTDVHFSHINPSVHMYFNSHRGYEGSAVLKEELGQCWGEK